MILQTLKTYLVEWQCELICVYLRHWRLSFVYLREFKMSVHCTMYKRELRKN